MTQETRIALLLIGELVTALRANDPDTFKRWLVGGIQDLGKPAVTELMADWMTPLLTKEDADRLVAWQLWVSFYLRESGHPSSACQIDNENLIKN